jgi:hypothetical protein
LDTFGASRKVILLRRKLPKDRIGIIKKSNTPTQLDFFFVDLELDTTAYKYQILVTNMTDGIAHL